MYKVDMQNTDGKMVRVSIEMSMTDAYEMCAELVRSGKTMRAIGYGIDFENRHDNCEVYARVRSV